MQRRAPARPGRQYLRSILPRLQARIQDHYGVAVSFVEIPPPFTGDLDGAEVRIHQDHEVGAAVFTLGHLFGHTVQWNVSGRARDVGSKPPGSYSERELAEVVEYEREASRYSVQLFHEAGVSDLDPWLSDYAAADLRFLLHFYETGVRKPLAACWIAGQPSLAPLAIPPFRPRRFKFRWAGVVL
jgi:hypothetical protein